MIMGSSHETEDEILQRHKKEKKELQAKIQALKKTATKGDKKKKKETTEEIVKLETDLNKKHDEELESLTKLNETSEVTEQLSQLETNDEPKGRISKAQKRRDKKAIKEKVRNEEIEAQEIENLQGVRHLETLKLKELLKERGLSIVEVPSDGDCLYAALGIQIGFKISDLRKRTSESLRENAERFLPFMTSPLGENLTESEFEEYCQAVASTSAWGGEIEITALADNLKYCIEILQAEGPSRLFGEKYGTPKATLCFHRHMYGLGAHYNAVGPYREENEDKKEEAFIET